VIPTAKKRCCSRGVAGDVRQLDDRNPRREGKKKRKKTMKERRRMMTTKRKRRHRVHHDGEEACRGTVALQLAVRALAHAAASRMMTRNTRPQLTARPPVPQRQISAT